MMGARMNQQDPIQGTTRTRFSGIDRLYGTNGAARLRAAHVVVVGIGGVGSWTAEALARSAVGRLTLVDLDDVCVSNVNRQIHALDGTVGQPKIEAMADRIRRINPDITLDLRHCFLTAKNVDEFVGPEVSVVVDAIDAVTHKCVLIARCREHGQPMVTVGSAGGRRNPMRIETADLAKSHNDPLLARVRKALRQQYGFPRNQRKNFRVPCIFSSEPIVYPQADGGVCEKREDGALRLDCNTGYGTASFVTGAFGFAAAALAVEQIVNEVSGTRGNPHDANDAG